MSGLVAATIIAGVLLIVMGVMRLGTLIRFVPHTITTGFTAGIAVTIVIGQLKDFMGLAYPAGTAPIESMDKLACVVQNLGTLNVQALAVGLACLAVLVLWPRVTERVPASLVAVLAGIALVSGLNLSVNTIGDLYSIQGGAPRFAMPQLSLDLLAPAAAQRLHHRRHGPRRGAAGGAGAAHALRDADPHALHPNDQPMRTMERVGFVDQVGRENFLPNIDAAIARAAVLVDEK